jgi:transcriptional regulatory protein LevR/transcriptional regulator with AAA-type ATPase domain
VYEEGKVLKIKGKPVIYTVNGLHDGKRTFDITGSFDTLIGSDKSLKKCIQQAKAAILYPPHGLHTLLIGPTGVGKGMFAELMYIFAVEKGVFSAQAPFVSFNCADYANNPQLLLTHLFGCKKGAFTGADRDRLGIVDKAIGGILFLDEVHRLPPEGQEMLFTLIDKGIYTPLGEIDSKKIGDVLIVCATTEDANSSLLSTFTRRIPMTISLPSLKERTLEERFELICELFKIESRRIGREIVVSSNAIRSLLLYNCNGNVGQLKSDIQLGCANAFLKCISKGKKRIDVHSTDFSTQVKQGLLLYKYHAEEVDKIVKGNVKLSFTPKGKEEILEIRYDDYSLPNSFYEDIERRIQELQSRGVEEEDINFIMSLDIENYFKKYIQRFEQGVRKEEISKIVDSRIIALVEKFLESASVRMKKTFSNQVFYGLCLHISASLERLRSDKKIANPNLKEIIEKYPDQYALALHFSGILEKEFGVNIPVDEVGFIAMFLRADELQEELMKNKPIVVVAMHGKSTASSMAEVANKLVGGDNVFSYDMNLDKEPKEAYEELKVLIVKHHQGAGVLLLVDMGSLGMFGELISEETGIEIRVLDMVTTSVVIECARKALVGKSIQEVWEETKNNISYLSHYHASFSQTFLPDKDHIILTVCATGEGSAIKLKHMIEEKIDLVSRNIQIIPMAINDKKVLVNRINKLSEEKKILAIVGILNPNIYGIPYIPTSELFSDPNLTKLKEAIQGVGSRDPIYNEMFESLARKIEDVDMQDFQPLCMDLLSSLEQMLNKELGLDKKVGLILHLACAVSRLLKGEHPTKFQDKEVIKKE